MFAVAGGVLLAVAVLGFIGWLFAEHASNRTPRSLTMPINPHRRMIFIKELESSLRTECAANGIIREDFNAALARWHDGHPPLNDTHARVFQVFHDRQKTIRAA